MFQENPNYCISVLIETPSCNTITPQGVFMLLNENSDKKVIPIAGGKGGVGKSILSTNLALLLAVHGKKTVLVDLDLGGSNVHTMLGMKNTHKGIGHFIHEPHMTIESLLVKSPYENLSIIPGDVTVYGLGELNFETKKRITMGILELDADYIIVDLGAGTSMNVLDFFLISNSGILVSTPHTTSITNTFNFLKSLTYRFLQRLFSENKVFIKELNRLIKETEPNKEIPINDFLNKMELKDSESIEKARYFLQALQPKIVLNMADEKEDLQMAHSLSELVKEKLSLSLECLGMLFYDRGIGQSLKDRVPYLQEHNDTVTAAGLNRIAQKILQSENFPEMPLDFEYYSDTFELTELEADQDFELKQQEGGDGLYSEQYVQGLMNRIEEQEEMIQRLVDTIQNIGVKL